MNPHLAMSHRGQPTGLSMRTIPPTPTRNQNVYRTLMISSGTNKTVLNLRIGLAAEHLYWQIAKERAF